MPTIASVEIGNLSIKIGEKKTTDIKNQILEARFDDIGSKQNTGSKYYYNYHL